MASNWIKARQTKYGAYVAGYILVVLAVLVALNWLAKENNKSFDTTTNKRFSLSEQTVKTVKNLKNDVSLTYFDRTASMGSARDLLDRYSNLSSKLHVNYVDPVKKPDVARASGFRSMGGVVVQSGSKTEEAGSLTEEGVTNALIRVNKTVQKNVCFVTGSGEMSPTDTERSGLSFAKEQIEKNTYKTTTFSLLEKQQVPSDCAAVIIAGPKRDYLDVAVNALKTYVEGGGHVLFSLGAPVSGARTADASLPTPNLNKLLEGWGVTLNQDLVVDPGSRMFGFSEAAPLAAKYESHPIVRDLSGIATVFPLAQSLTLGSGKGVEALFSSSDSSLAVSNPKLPLKLDPNTAKKGPFTLGAAGTIGSGAKQGRFVVVGSSDWMGNSLLSVAQIANRDLFLNTVNWLTADEDLISIRPKNPEDQHISMTRRSSYVVLLTSLIFLPLLVIGWGVTTWWQRR
jgi:ABC-type uncharacterized transport system involved in gliding motility auxiliary subunit